MLVISLPKEVAMAEKKQDCEGRSLNKGSRVRWVGNNLKFSSEDHANGYRDVKSRARGTIVGFKSNGIALVLLDGHVKPVTLGFRGLELTT